MLISLQIPDLPGFGVHGLGFESVKAAKSDFNGFTSILLARRQVFSSFEKVSNGCNEALQRL